MSRKWTYGLTKHGGRKAHRKRRSGRGSRGFERLRFESLETRLVLSTLPMITEFLADNETGLADPNGNRWDWVEVYNPADTTADMTGWKLEGENNSWQFPDAYAIGPHEFRVLFCAGGNPETPPPAPYVDFGLGKDGEPLRLRSSSNVVVQEFNPFPKQKEDISYGLGMTENELVASGITTRYYVPTNDAIRDTWMGRTFSDAAWAAGPTGIGFASGVAGFDSTAYRANLSVGSLSTALSVIGTPSYQVSTANETAPTINYLNAGGGGHYTGDRAVPGTGGVGVNTDNYVIRATGVIHIPDTGDWTFGINSDEGFRLKIAGAAFTSITPTSGSDSHSGFSGDTMWYDGLRAANDSLGVVSNLAAGDYPVEIVYFENIGASSLEFFAAPGSFSAFGANVFHLVGDTANGGLPVYKALGQPSSPAFAGLVTTDVRTAMQPAGNSFSSLYTRMTFSPVDVGSLQSVVLRVKYDDGYVAYLNGEEIARRNAPTTLGWDARATAERGDAEATLFDDVLLAPYVGLLMPTALVPAGGMTSSGTTVTVHLPGHGFNDGEVIHISGAVQQNYNGDFTVHVTDSDHFTYTFAGGSASPATGTITAGRNNVLAIQAMNRSIPAHTVTSLAGAGLTATATMPQHGFADGDVIRISGVTPAQWNGDYVISGVTDSTFQYTLVTAPTADAGGTMTASRLDLDMLMLPEITDIFATSEEHFFSTPTPGDVNSQSFWLAVADTKFSADRGLYDNPFPLAITTATSGANIYYTLDGTDPRSSAAAKAVTGIVVTAGTTATATLAAGHGFVEDQLVSITGATQSQFNGLFVIRNVTGTSFQYTVPAGTPPSANGTIMAQAVTTPVAVRYTVALTISHTTTIRAAAFKTAYLATNVDTETYIFPTDVMSQPANPSGYPTTWGGVSADYAMDARVVYDPLYKDGIVQDLLSLPTMSIVTDAAGLFGPSGIYANPTADDLEAPVSFEYFDPATGEEFQIDAALRMYGGYGRNAQFKKHSMRVIFKAPYGPTNLDFDLFGDGATQEFDSILLRSNFNDGWTWGGSQAQYIRDQFARSSLLAMGQPASHGAFVHLYINGLYWGLYNPSERPDAAFAATYFGGDKDNWDAINAGYPVSSTDATEYQALTGFNYQGGSTAAYQQVQGNNPDGTPNPAYPDLLDVDNYIDYMLMNFYIGNADWPWQNFYTARQEDPGSTGFKSFPWDSEMALGLSWQRDPLTANETGVNQGLGIPYAGLRYNVDFQMRFADHAQKALFNNGALTPTEVQPRYQALATLVDSAIVTESARWGDVVLNPGTLPFTQSTWRTERDFVMNSWLTQRTSVMVNQLRSAGLYPSIDAPAYSINGAAQHGGTIQPPATLTISIPAGSVVYYSLDGTDPRLPGGALNLAAVAAGSVRQYTGPITLSENARFIARAYIVGNGTWSALADATFYVDLAPSIRISELMYHPALPTPAETAANYTVDDFEYIEIKNIGTRILPLGGLRLTNGVDFVFPDDVPGTTRTLTIEPGQYMLVVSNEAAFRMRYPACTAVIVGEYTGVLADAGEKIQLDSPIGGIVQEFTYKDGWYGQTDGEGFSLTVRNPSQTTTLWDSSDGWRASAATGGTPGYADTLMTPGSVVVNEVLAHSDEDYGDAVELYNTTDQRVYLSGWYLSDEAANLKKYQIHDGAFIEPGGYLVLTQRDNFGQGAPDPGRLDGFGLSEYGDFVYLSSNVPGAPGVVGGYREHVDFGGTPNGLPVGLCTKTTGNTDFTLLAGRTFGTWQVDHFTGEANSDPYVSPLAINEVMYHPTALVDAVVGITRTDSTATVTIPRRGYANGDTVQISGASQPEYNGSFVISNVTHGATTTTFTYTVSGSPTTPALGAVTCAPATYTDADYEYVEIYNRSGQPQTLSQFGLTGGIGFTFGWVPADLRGGTTEEARTREAGATATWNATALGSATYHVYATYRLDDPLVLLRNLDDTAQYKITYSGGNTTLIVNQDNTAGRLIEEDPVTHRRTLWVDLGSYSFVNTGSVVLTRSADAQPGDDTLADKIVFRRDGFADKVFDNPALGSPFMQTGVTTVPDGGYVVVASNKKAFQLRYGTTIPVAGSYTGHLNNDGDEVALSKYEVSDADPVNGYIPTYKFDHVDFGDSGNWPTEADGSGPALNRVQAAKYANDPYNWAVSAIPGTPGLPNQMIDRTPPTAPTGLTIHTVVATSTVAVSWTASADPDSSVDHYAIYRDGMPIGTSSTTSFTDTAVPAPFTYAYEVSAVNRDGYESARSPAVAIPHVVSIETPNTTRIRVYFNEPLDPASIQPVGGHFAMTGGSITTATLNPEGTVLSLTTASAMVSGNSYSVTMSGLTTVSGREMPSSVGISFKYSTDNTPPTAVITAVAPDPRNSAVSQVIIVFNEAVSNFDWSDLVLTRNGGANLLTASQALSTVDNVTFTLPNLSGLTSAAGTYVLTLGGGVNDSAGNTLAGIASETWTTDTTRPTAAVTAVAPDPRNSSVSRITIVFSEPVAGFDRNDLSLKRSGGADLLTAAQTLTTTDNITWVLGNLFGLTASTGTYVLALTASGSGIADAAGNSMTANASDTWTMNTDGTPPTATIAPVAPDPRYSAVPQITIVFSEPVTGFDLADLSLIRGATSLLPGSATLTTADNITWILGNLSGLTGTVGSYSLTLTAAGSGIRDAAIIAMTANAADAWVVNADTTAPTAAITSPGGLRNSAVPEMTIVFSEPVTGLDLADLSLARYGGRNLLGGPQTLTSADGITWTLGNLAVLTDEPGNYVLTLAGSGTGIVDSAGNPLSAGAVVSWTTHTTPPEPTIAPVAPDPRTSAVDSMTITFSEPIASFDRNDLTLRRDGGVNLLTTAQTLTTTDNITWTLGNLAGITGTDGKYVLALAAAGSGVVDSAGNALLGNAADAWARDFTPPTADIVDVAPDPRNTGVPSITLQFSEPVTGFGLADLGLVHDGSPIDLSAATLATTDQQAWTLSGLAGLTAAGGSYTLTLTATGIADAIGNVMTASAGDTWAVDAIAPTVDIVDIAPDPRKITVPSILIQFSEAISGFNLGDLVLTRGGNQVALAGATLSTTDQRNWTLGNLTGLTATSGSYALTLTAAGAGIADLAGNPLVGSASDNWVVDMIAPTVDIVDVAPDPRNTAVSQVSIVFSEPITGFDMADLNLTHDGGANLLTAAQTLTTTDNATWTLGNLAGITGLQGNYVLILTVGASGIADAAGNGLAASASDVWTTDPNPPTADITDVLPDPRAEFVPQMTIVFSEPVTGFNLADLSLTRDGGANLLTASQTLTTTDNVTWTLGNLGDLTSFGGTYAMTLTAAGSGIADGVNNPLSGNASDTWVMLPGPPTVISIGLPLGATNPTNATSVQFAVTFNKTVTGVDWTDFALALTGTATGTISSSVAGSGASYTVTVNGITGSGSLGLNLVDNDSIVDLSGQALGGTGSGNGNFTGQAYTVDRTPPAVASINRAAANPTNAAGVQFTVTFSEDVTGVDAADFSLALSGVTGSIASVAGGGASYTVTVNGVSGNGTLGLNLVDDDGIVDLLGNLLGGTGSANGDFTGQAYTIDNTSPAVVSINRTGSNPTGNPTIYFAVTFGEGVTGVDPADFALAPTGGVTGTIAAVTGSGTSYVVRVANVSGTGALGLNLVDDDTIADLAGNPLGGTGAGNGSFTGQTYTIDPAYAPKLMYWIKPVEDGSGNYRVIGDGNATPYAVAIQNNPGAGQSGTVSFELYASIDGVNGDALDDGYNGGYISILNAPPGSNALIGTFAAGGTAGYPAPAGGAAGAVALEESLRHPGSPSYYGGKVQDVGADGAMDIGGVPIVTGTVSSYTYIRPNAGFDAGYVPLVAHGSRNTNPDSLTYGYTDVLVGTFQFQYNGGTGLVHGSSTSLNAAPMDVSGTNYHWFKRDGSPLAGTVGGTVAAGRAVTIAVSAVTGTPDADVIRIVRNASEPTLADVSITTGGSTTRYSVPLAEMPQWNVSGLGGDDRLEVDLTAGDFLPAGGLTFDGGAGSDTLAIVGKDNVGDNIIATGSQLTVNGIPVRYSGTESFAFPLGAVQGVNDTLTLDGASLRLTQGADALSAGTAVKIDLGGTLELAAGQTATVASLEIVDGRVAGGTVSAGSALDDSHKLDAGSVDASLSGPGGLTKDGGGTATLAKPNDYQGATTVKAGTLEVDNALALPATTDLVIDGGTVVLHSGLGRAIELSGLSMVIPLAPRKVSVGDVARDEGDSGTTSFDIPITLSIPVPAGQSVEVTATASDGTATTAAGDYAALQQAVVFGPGESLKYVTISVNGDTRLEANETFFVTLSDPLYNGASDPAQLIVDPAHTIGTGTIRNGQDNAIFGTEAGDVIRIIRGANPDLIGISVTTGGVPTTSDLVPRDIIQQPWNILGLGGDDRLEVDFSNDSPLPAGGLVYNGGAGGGDALVVVGKDYVPYSLIATGNQLTINGNPVGFSSVESFAFPLGAAQGIKNTLTIDGASLFLAQEADAISAGTALTIDHGGGLELAAGQTVTVASLEIADGGVTGGTLRADSPLADSHKVMLGSIDSALSGPGGLTKDGGGTVTLTKPNDYQGATTVNAGRLEVDDARALPATTCLVIGGGTVALQPGLGRAVELSGLSLNLGAVGGAPPPALPAASQVSGTDAQGTPLAPQEVGDLAAFEPSALVAIQAVSPSSVVEPLTTKSALTTRRVPLASRVPPARRVPLALPVRDLTWGDAAALARRVPLALPVRDLTWGDATALAEPVAHDSALAEPVARASAPALPVRDSARDVVFAAAGVQHSDRDLAWPWEPWRADQSITTRRVKPAKSLRAVDVVLSMPEE